MCEHSNIKEYFKSVPFYEQSDKYDDEGAICNFCGMCIDGIIFHCNDCHEHDRCKLCYNHLEGQHKEKPFEKCFLCEKNKCAYHHLEYSNKINKSDVKEIYIYCNNCGFSIANVIESMIIINDVGILSFEDTYREKFNREDYYYKCAKCSYICCGKCYDDIKLKEATANTLINNKDIINI
jgi:hypothetical protein